MSFGRIVAWLALSLALAGCAPTAHPAAQAARHTGADDFKIGVMTGTVSQGEEEFRAGQQIERTYGPRVRHITYPDDFVQEQATVIAQLTGLAADPDIRVIVVSQAVPGSVAAARRIRQMRPDVLIGFVGAHEDADSVDQVCDIAIQADELARGATIVDTAHQMGARNFVHYSFPRHMAQPLLAARRDAMKLECAKRGMNFYFVTAPDPMGEGSLPEAQQFILEDVPRQLARLGKQTAFFCTNDGMQEPLIKSILAEGGLFVEQDAPAPTAGYPAALGLSIPAEHEDDMPWINAEIKRLIAERGATGRFGSWVAPVSMVTTRAIAHLLVDAVDHRADCRDSSTVARYVAAECNGSPVKLRRYGPNSRQFLVILDHVTY